MKFPVKKYLRILGFAILAAIVIGTFVFLYKKSRPKTIVYEILVANKQNIKKNAVATGKVEPRDEILIKPQINGIIAEVFKEAGQTVRVDEVIAKVKVVPEMGSLNNAESQVNLSKIALDKAKSDFERAQKLFKDGVMAQEEYDGFDVAHKRAKEDHQAAQDALEIIKTGISKRSSQYSTTLIRSTVNGLILDVPIKVGSSVVQSNNFNDGTTIATVANMNDMIFRGKIDESEVGRLKPGMPIELSIGAMQSVTLQAKLEQIAPKGVEENGAILFEIKAAVHIPDSVFIRAGYSSNATIVLDRRDSVIGIPETALEFSGDSAFVYKLVKEKPKQEFKRTYVKLGLSDGINVEILKGVTLREKLRGNPVVEEKNKK